MDDADVTEIPDSLVKIFKTKNGRDVIDGRGIEPDILVEEKELSRLVITLVQNNFFFDYATQFYYNHPEISDAKTFSLTDQQYEDFKAYVLAETFEYSTATEEMLKRMRETAEEEGFYSDAEKEYEALMSRVVPSKERDLDKFKPQIKSILENEIVSRYYYQKGRAEYSFREDDSVIESMKVLKDISKYNTILK
jgi:carboxyl-terminal processing protease